MLGIAGLSQDYLNKTIAEGIKGNTAAVDEAYAQAAANLGMPSAANLRDQLLPALGVELE